MKLGTKRFWKWTLISIASVLIIAITGFVLWALNTPTVGKLATSALKSSDTVTVSQQDGATFRPTEPNGVGFILYQGAKVPPASYAYAAQQIAARGYTVFVPQLRLNLAVLDIDAATRVINANPDLSCWAVGGHSLGGAMAAEYAKDHEAAGLVFWAAYPADATNLSNSGVHVASIYGTRDGLTTPEKIEASKNNLPGDTRYTAIKGGNHAQFGDYGKQSGDNEADITLKDQQDQLATATLQLLSNPDLCATKKQ